MTNQPYDPYTLYTKICEICGDPTPKETASAILQTIFERALLPMSSKLTDDQRRQYQDHMKSDATGETALTFLESILTPQGVQGYMQAAAEVTLKEYFDTKKDNMTLDQKEMLRQALKP